MGAMYHSMTLLLFILMSLVNIPTSSDQGTTAARRLKKINTYWKLSADNRADITCVANFFLLLGAFLYSSPIVFFPIKHQTVYFRQHQL